MKTKFSKITAAILAVLMLMSVLPAAYVSGAAQANNGFKQSQLTVVNEKASTLAPGVTLDTYTVYDKNGDQVKMFVTTADMNVDSVKVFSSYKDMDPTNYGMSKLTEQVACFNEKAAAGDEYYQGTVVAGINTSYYNMITGKPTGAFAMNGIDVTNESEGNNYGYFAVMKDGTYKIGNKGDYSKDKGNIQEALGIHTMLIIDGTMVSNLDDAKKYPRQTIGLTADNKIVLMTADGNQAPNSIGLTLREQAQVMADLGCVWAGHLDGGGSATYGCKPEGSDKFAVTNSPSDGSERSVSNGFIIVSTEAPSFDFDHVVYDVENEYVTPGSSVKVDFSGVSSTGHAAEIPADITFTVDNGTFADGVFTAGKDVKTATITAVSNGKKVGTVEINVVVPDSIKFGNEVLTVPFGKTVDLGITAFYGVKEVVINTNDIIFDLSDDAVGTIEGFNFISGQEGVAATTSTLTATLSLNTEVKATATINLGKGSEVVYDFEDGTSQNLIFNESPGTVYNYVWTETTQQVVTAETGKVHSGNYALAGKFNYSNNLESGYMRTCMYATEDMVFENAVGVGVWIYIPKEAVGLWARWTLRAVTVNADGTYTFGGSINSNVMDTGAGGTGVVYSFQESGWHYLYADTSAYSAVGWKANSAMIQFYISDRDGSAYNYKAAENSNIPSTYQFYFDDVTVDYSTAVDDREAPVFTNLTYAVEGMADAAALNGQTVTDGKVTFGVNVKDYTGKTNYTGVDASTVKAYVDGVEVEATYANGMVSIVDAELANGKHTVKFSACDKMGNYGSIIGNITVNAAESKSTVKLVAADPDAKYIKLSSIYNMNLVATAIEEVSEVEVVVNLDNNSTWELDHMVPADGFEATYTIDETDNIATITLKKVSDTEATGEAVLATLPVRVWTLKTGYVYPNGTKAGLQAFTLAQFKTMQEFWRMSVIANVEKGILTRVDQTVDTFTGERVFCDTEMWGNYATMKSTTDGLAYYNAWDGGHVHTAEAMDDKAATCTEEGFEGRTYCEVCQSVVDWGTDVPATGHSYDFIEGVLSCVCGEVFSGVYTDGKTYVDGLVVADGWNGDSYFVDGVALKGIQNIDGTYYDFGEDGICLNQTKFTGLFFNEKLNAYSYSKLGKLTTGWVNIDDEWYYFFSNGKAATGLYENYFFSYGVTYEFEENGKLTEGVWHERYINGEHVGTMYFYGPACYKSGWQTIDGNRYFFDGIYRAEGPHMIMESNAKVFKCFVFDENGVYTDGTYTGFVETNGDLFYVEDNIARTEGMFKLGEDYYYAHSNGKLAITATLISRPNGYVAEGVRLPFEANGRLYNGIYKENGNLYYYVMGTRQGRGLYYNEQGDYYVYVKSTGTLATGNYEVKATGTNGLLDAGYYLFDENGKMMTGVVEENGELYFYRHGVKQGRGVHYVEDGDYYVYVRSTGTCAVGYYEVKESAANGLLNPQFYMFGDDGKLLRETGVKSVAGNKYYFIDGAKQGRGLYYNAEENYYVYVKSNETVATGRYYVNATNGLVDPGYLLFDENGYSVTDVVSENGNLYYYVNGIQQDRGVYYNEEGDFYVYVRSTGTLATGKYDVKENDLIDAGYYLFDENGKTVSDVVVENGNLYYYEHGIKQGRGMYYNAQGDFYVYVKSNGTLATGRYYVNATNDLLPKAYYNFGTDGKLTF